MRNASKTRGCWKKVKRGFTNYQPKKLLKTSKTRFYKLPAMRFEFSKTEKFKKNPKKS